MKQRKAKRQKKTVTPANRPRMELIVSEVDNPLYMRAHDGANTNHRKITALVNVRESSIEYLYSRNMIDDAQKAAGGKFRAYWETAGGRGAKAIDYSKEHVDSSGVTDPVPDKMLQAGFELKACRNLLGLRGFELMEKVAGEGLMIADISKLRSERDALMYMLKDGLNVLASYWGYSTRRRASGR